MNPGRRINNWGKTKKENRYSKDEERGKGIERKKEQNKKRSHHKEGEGEGGSSACM